MFSITLKSLLTDALRTKKILSRQEVKKIARDNGYEESNAERRLRSEKNSIPCIKLNYRKKPIGDNEHIEYYRWDGGKTILNKYKKELDDGFNEIRKRAKRPKLSDDAF